MKRNNIITAAVLTVLAGLLAASCQKTTIQQENRQDEGTEVLTFSPVVSEYVNPESELTTKGTLINDETTKKSIAFPTTKEFYVAAWNIPTTGDPVPFITDFQTVKYFNTQLAPGVNRNMWNTIGADGKIVEYTWRPLADKQTPETNLFYAYSNLSTGSEVAASIDGSTHKPVMVLDHTVPTAASAQTDILLGGYKGNGKDNSSGIGGTATINFQHPLTAVKITMGTVKATKSFSIKSVSLEGIYAGGKATMKDDMSITWAPAEVEGVVVTTTVSQDITTTPASGSKLQIGETFIVMPQAFASNESARIKVSVTADGRDLDLYYPLVDSDNWQAGHVVTYEISYNGHEGVQLWENGPYWATKNVGAESSDEYGWFFSWGNVDGYVPTGMAAGSTTCTWKTPDGTSTLSGGFSDGNYRGTPGASWAGAPAEGDYVPDATHDAAYKHMGEKWRMPTEAELQALLNNTNHAFIYRNGHSGYLFTGKSGIYASRSIFIPSAGYGAVTEYNEASYTGMCWSCTIATTAANGKAYFLYWKKTSGEYPEDVLKVDNFIKYYGRTIRAVENVPYVETPSGSGN